MVVEIFRYISLFCLIYFIFIMLYVGPRLSFHYTWFAMAFFSYMMIKIIKNGVWENIPIYIKIFGINIVAVMVGIFIVMEIHILSKMFAKPYEEVDYVIVLGACVRGTRVTRSLSWRLKKAAAYAKEDINCKIVVSGGQGPGEDISEALAMYRYLINLGVNADRILMEDKSVNTRENLMFSKTIIDTDIDNRDYKKEKLKIAICSNNFHIYRAMELAKAISNWKVYGLAAPTDPFMWLSFTVREGAALFKEQILHHI